MESDAGLLRKAMGLGSWQQSASCQSALEQPEQSVETIGEQWCQLITISKKEQNRGFDDKVTLSKTRQKPTNLPLFRTIFT
jgi:hypothetical protein